MSKVTVDNLRKARESADRDISGVAAAWQYMTISGGTVTLEDSLNVSSITDVGVGDFTVNFSNGMDNALFAVSIASQYSSASGTGAFFDQEDVLKRAVGSHGMNHFQNAGLSDPLRMSSVTYGDLA